MGLIARPADTHVSFPLGDARSAAKPTLRVFIDTWIQVRVDVFRTRCVLTSARGGYQPLLNDRSPRPGPAATVVRRGVRMRLPHPKRIGVPRVALGGRSGHVGSDSASACAPWAWPPARNVHPVRGHRSRAGAPTHDPRRAPVRIRKRCPSQLQRCARRETGRMSAASCHEASVHPARPFRGAPGRSMPPRPGWPAWLSAAPPRAAWEEGVSLPALRLFK